MGAGFLKQIRVRYLGIVDDYSSTTEGTGYLLFENEQGSRELVSAQKLDNLLSDKEISLVVLSACQSAAVNASAESSELREKRRRKKHPLLTR